MAREKLSETFRGLAEHTDPVASAWAKMTRAALHGVAGTLEASPWTFPGMKVPPPAAPVAPESQGGQP